MNVQRLNVAVIKGDGVGSDVIESALAVIEAAERRIGSPALNITELNGGAQYFKETGRDMAPGAEESAGESDAIFLGAIGLPHIRHEDGTEISPHLRLREKFQLYAGVRPARAYPNIPRQLTHEKADEIDLVIVRESTEGLFYTAAVHKRNPVADDSEVQEIMRITRPTTEKLHRFAFKLAEKRKHRGKSGMVTCVDKANVFRSMALFRKIFDEQAQNFPDIGRSYSYVDAQALNLIKKPWEYDVMVMENIFGDILSDLVGALVGGMGMAACGEIGDKHALFQPAHGSAPDIAGQDKANPLATILSGAMMLDYLADKFDQQKPAEAALLIEDCIYNGFSENRIRPMEFGGDMGTRAVTLEVVRLIEEYH